jgi:hypothetical protein
LTQALPRYINIFEMRTSNAHLSGRHALELIGSLATPGAEVSSYWLGRGGRVAIESRRWVTGQEVGRRAVDLTLSNEEICRLTGTDLASPPDALSDRKYFGWLRMTDNGMRDSSELLQLRLTRRVNIVSFLGDRYHITGPGVGAVMMPDGTRDMIRGVVITPVDSDDYVGAPYNRFTSHPRGRSTQAGSEDQHTR